MRLIIVRHGETEWNIKGIIQGHSDTKLNEKGLEQARKVAKRLKWMKIDVAYVSDLIRAKETAGEILKYHTKTKVYYTKALREKSFGIFEGKQSEEITKARKKANLSFEKFKPEGGESSIEVQKRVSRLYQQVCRKHPQETVLFVSHGSTIRTLLQEIFLEAHSKESYEKLNPENCAVTILEIDGKGKQEVKAFNCVRHLEE